MALSDEIKSYDANRIHHNGACAYVNPYPTGVADPDLFYTRAGGVVFEVIDMDPAGGGGGLRRTYPGIPTERVYPAVRAERVYPL